MKDDGSGDAGVEGHRGVLRGGGGGQRREGEDEAEGSHGVHFGMGVGPARSGSGAWEIDVCVRADIGLEGCPSGRFLSPDYLDLKTSSGRTLPVAESCRGSMLRVMDQPDGLEIAAFFTEPLTIFENTLDVRPKDKQVCSRIGPVLHTAKRMQFLKIFFELNPFMRSSLRSDRLDLDDGQIAGHGTSIVCKEVWF